jgi:hypothetical protein
MSCISDAIACAREKVCVQHSHLMRLPSTRRVKMGQMKILSRLDTVVVESYSISYGYKCNLRCATTKDERRSLPRARSIDGKDDNYYISSSKLLSCLRHLWMNQLACGYCYGRVDRPLTRGSGASYMEPASAFKPEVCRRTTSIDSGRSTQLTIYALQKIQTTYHPPFSHRV